MEELLIIFSQSDYAIVSGGTEKCIREQEIIIGKNCMQIFPIKNFEKKYVGINFNQKFSGIYKLNKIPILIDKMQKKYNIIGLNIHHIKGYKLELLAQTLIEIDLPITIFMHDYYYICHSFKLINSENKFCGKDFANKDKCSNCKYKCDREIHIKELEKFLNKIDVKLEKIIVPSNYAKILIEGYFKKYKNKILIREHLVLKKERIDIQSNETKNKKIRIAYLGAQTKAKGFDVYSSLVKKFGKKYEWYYFGSGKEDIENLIKIDVQVAKQGNNAMVENLRKYKIDMAIIWPAWPETYSYVLYEALENKIFIITNLISGNIKDVVEKEKVGIVLNNQKELEMLFDDKICLENILNNHKKKFNQFKFNISINSEQKMLRFKKRDINYRKKRQKIKCSKNIILTLLYFLIKKRYN